MTPAKDNGEPDHTDEPRLNRLLAVLLAGFVPLMVMTVHRSLGAFPLQAYTLTVWQFGYILFVDERLSIRKSWLLRSMVPVTMLHLLFLGAIHYWDRFADAELMKPLVAIRGRRESGDRRVECTPDVRQRN